MIDLLAQTSLIVAVTSVGVGATVVARNPKNKLYLSFGGVCTILFIWSFAFFLDRLWPDLWLDRLHLFANIWLGPVVLVMIQGLTKSSKLNHEKWSRRLFDISLVWAVLLSGVVTLRWDETWIYRFSPNVVNWPRQFIYFAPIIVVIQILKLIREESAVTSLKNQRPLKSTALRSLTWIYLGALFVLATSVMDHVPFLGRVIPSLGNIALSIYLFFLSRAITQQKLLNFGALVTRFLVLMILALLLTGFYSLFVAWVENSPALFFLNSFIVSLLVLMLIDPIRALVIYATQRLLTQKHLRLVEQMREGQRGLTGVVELPHLFQSILLMSQQILNPQRVSLFILSSDGTRFRRVRVHSAFPDSPQLMKEPVREIIADHPLIQTCLKQQARAELPILLDLVLESEVERSTSAKQRETLKALIEALHALGGNLLIPLGFESGSPNGLLGGSLNGTLSEKMLGFVVILAPEAPASWGHHWGLLQVVYPYFEQAGQTLKNMEVYARSREKDRLAALGEMAAGLAHEIRNPLGAIKGAAQFLDPSSDRPESRFLRVILEEVDRLNAVVTQFLDYSRKESLDLREIDLAVLVRKITDLLKPSFPQTLRLDIRFPSEAIMVSVAPEQIQQVILNLVQNSLKAMQSRAGEERLLIALKKIGSRQNTEIHLTIEDNGPGIKRENLDKIFIPFFTTSPSGTGLGLSICQKIMEAHQGRVEVQSEEGRFTRFTLVFCVSGDNAVGVRTYG